MAFLDDVGVERCTLPWHASRRSNQGFNLARWQLLSVARTGRARDALVHKRAAKVVSASVQHCASALGTQLDPRGLNVGQYVPEGDPCDGVHQHGFTPGWPLPRTATAEYRRFHGHEAKRHELGQATGFNLQRSQA